MWNDENPNSLRETTHLGDFAIGLFYAQIPKSCLSLMEPEDCNRLEMLELCRWSPLMHTPPPPRAIRRGPYTTLLHAWLNAWDIMRENERKRDRERQREREREPDRERDSERERERQRETERDRERQRDHHHWIPPCPSSWISCSEIPRRGKHRWEPWDWRVGCMGVG